MSRPSGLQWLLFAMSKASSNSLSFEGINGTLRSMRLDNVQFSSSELNLIVQGFELAWQPSDLLLGRLTIQILSVQDIDIYSAPSETPSEFPNNLSLPLSVLINKLRVANLRLFAKNEAVPKFVASKLSVKLKSNGQYHHLSELVIGSKFGILNANAEIDGNQPFNLIAQAKFSGDAKLTTQQLTEITIDSVFSGNLERLHVKINGTGAGISGNADVKISPYAPLPITALRLAIEGFNPSLLFQDVPRANLKIHTDLSLESEKAKQLIGSLAVKNSVPGTIDSKYLPLREVSAHLSLSDELLHIDSIIFHLTDKGSVSGNATWNLNQLSGSANFTVSQLNPLILDNRLRVAQVSGQINLNGNNKEQDIIVKLKDKKLSLDINASHTADVVTLDRIRLSHGQSQLSGQGKLGLTDQQAFKFIGALKRFNLADFIQAPGSDLNTTLELAGNLLPQVTGMVNFKIEDSMLATNPVAGKGHIELNNFKRLKTKADLHVGSNHFRVNGNFGAPGDSLKLDIAAPALSQIGLDIDGSLNAQIKLGNNLNNPEVDFQVNAKDIALLDKHKITHLVANGMLASDSIMLKVNAQDYRKDKETQFKNVNINIAGKKSEHSIQAILHVNDELKVQLQVHGGLTQIAKTHSEFHWNGILSKLSATGLLPFDLLNATTLELSPKHIALGSAKFSMAGGYANIDLTEWTPKKWVSQGNFTDIAIRSASESINKQSSLILGGNWNITYANQLNGKIQIAREKGDWVIPGTTPLPLRLQTLDFSAIAKEGKVNSNLSIISQSVGQADAQLSLQFSQLNWETISNNPLNGRIDMELADISWLGPVLNGGVKSEGQVSLQANIAGSLNKPELAGAITGNNLVVALLDHGIHLQSGQLDARLDHSSLYIDKLNFSSPYQPPPEDELLYKVKLPEKPGNLSISGDIGLFGNNIDLNIELTQLPVVHQLHHWIILSGNNRVKLSKQKFNLSGKITADAGLLTQPPTGQPQLSNDIMIVGETKASTSNSLLNLDATLDLGQHFYLRASGLEGRLAGQLKLNNIIKQELHAAGSIATHDTTFQAYGQKLEVKRGIVNFNGPIDDPSLNVLAVRTGLSVEAGVEVIGTVRHPKVRLVSTPNVPDSEKLSWIVLGRSPDTSGLDTALLITAANSILGGQSGGGITKQISDALGVDEISLKQSNHGNNPLTSQIGVIGKRLSSRAYISYERGLATATIGVTKLTYNLTPSITVATQAGADNAVDLFYTLRFD